MAIKILNIHVELQMAINILNIHVGLPMVIKILNTKEIKIVHNTITSVNADPVMP